MAVVTRSAASKAEISTKSQGAGIMVSLLTIVFFTTTIVLSTGIALFFHNCKVADKVWIPKSQGFCKDVSLSIQNFELRPTLTQNLEISLQSLYSTLLTRVAPSFSHYTQHSDEYVERFRTFVIETYDKIGQSVENFFGHDNQVFEYMSNVSKAIYGTGKQYYDHANKFVIKSMQSLAKTVDQYFN